MLDINPSSHITGREQDWLMLTMTALRDGKEITSLPRSEIFYARAAIEARCGVRLALDRVHELLVEEGLYPPPGKKEAGRGHEKTPQQDR